MGEELAPDFLLSTSVLLVWEVVRDCPYVKLKLTRVVLKSISRLRNSSGSHCTCVRCFRKCRSAFDCAMICFVGLLGLVGGSFAAVPAEDAAASAADKITNRGDGELTAEFRQALVVNNDIA